MSRWVWITSRIPGQCQMPVATNFHEKGQSPVKGGAAMAAFDVFVVEEVLAHVFKLGRHLSRMAGVHAVR